MPIILRMLTGLFLAKFGIGLAFGVLTFTAYIELLDWLKASFQTAWGGMPVAAIGYLEISGITTAVGYILTAIAVRAGFMFLPKFGLFGS